MQQEGCGYIVNAKYFTHIVVSSYFCFSVKFLHFIYWDGTHHQLYPPVLLVLRQYCCNIFVFSLNSYILCINEYDSKCMWSTKIYEPFSKLWPLSVYRERMNSTTFLAREEWYCCVHNPNTESPFLASVSFILAECSMELSIQVWTYPYMYCTSCGIFFYHLCGLLENSWIGHYFHWGFTFETIREMLITYMVMEYRHSKE